MFPDINANFLFRLIMAGDALVVPELVRGRWLCVTKMAFIDDFKTIIFGIIVPPHMNQHVMSQCIQRMSIFSPFKVFIQ